MTYSVSVEEVDVIIGDVMILENISFYIDGPGIVQILGPNGAGKTTLLKTILGLVEPVKGKVRINGNDVTGNPMLAGRFIGYMPQLVPAENEHFPITLWELVELEYLLRKGNWPRLFSSRHVKKEVSSILLKVGLSPDLWNRNVWRLSGGERQRALIARALVHDPPILALDEPFSAVDPAGRAELARLIGSLSENKLILATSHDPMLLLPYTRTIILVNRRIYAIGDPEEVLTLDNTRKVYGEAAIPIRERIHICDYHIA